MSSINNLGGGTPNNGGATIYDFFDRLASFDTETTGIDTSKDRVWQAGFTKKGIDTEEVINPFFHLNVNTGELDPDFLTPDEFKERLRLGNGAFSEKAFLSGNFDSVIKEHATGNLSNSLGDALDKTLGNLSRGDVLVLQNHNFENKLIQTGYENGLIDGGAYERIKNKMEYTSVDAMTQKTTGVLQTPLAAAAHVRSASFLYNSSYIDSVTDKKSIFKNYTNTLNKAMDAYSAAIASPTRGAIVIEQMDVTRSLFANAIEAGLMDSRHSQIGLKLDFLNKALGYQEEAHTALADSQDTLRVFKRTWEMNNELRSGNISTATRDTISTINTMQYTEVHKQFMDSVSSVLTDFDTKGYTRYAKKGSIHLSPLHVQEASTGNIDILPGRSSGGTRKEITALDTALNNILSRYSEHDNKELRNQYIDKVRESLNSDGVSKTVLFTDSYRSSFNLDDLKVGSPLQSNQSWWSDQDHLFGRQMSRGAKYSLIGGTILGLGYMMSKDSPEKQEENSYVAQQFYDEQYLGTQFVNFNERNKHYMY